MNNDIGLQTAYWSGTNLDIYQIIDFTKKANLDVIELKTNDFVHLTKQERSSIIKYIKNAGLSITVNGTGLQTEKDISSSNKEYHKAGIKHLCNMLDICAEMGTQVFSGIPYGLWNTFPDSENIAEIKKIHTENAIIGLTKVAKYAEKVGVVLCLEIVNRFEQYIANTVEEGIAICKAIHNDYCKLLLDTFHMNIEEDYIPDAICKAYEKGYIGYIHIGESNRKIPTGKNKTNIDWEAIAQTIKKINYKGPLVMEAFVLDKSPNAKNVSLWRTIKQSDDIDGLVSDVSEGVNYLKSL